MKKILNKLNQSVSRLPQPLAKLLGAKVPKPISWGLLVLVGWPLLLTVLFLFWLIPYMMYSEVDLFFYLKDYTMLGITDFFVLLAVLYTAVLLWYWRSKHKSLQKLVKVMLFILFVELIASFWYGVLQINFFEYKTWNISEADVDFLKWQYENRDIIALENIEIYVEALFKTVAVTAVAVVGWLFFKKRDKA